MKNAARIAIFSVGLMFCSGCIWSLPEGDVPKTLVGEENKKIKDDSLPLKDAEAAMSGAIIRTMIRKGHSSKQVPLAFHSAENQHSSFRKLLESTGMIRFSKQDSALYLIESQIKNGIWKLRLVKKDGTVILSKTVKYRQVP